MKTNPLSTVQVIQRVSQIPLKNVPMVLPSLGSVQSAQNPAYLRKVTNANKVGNQFDEYVSQTQLPGFDYQKCSIEELNILLVGFISGTGNWPPLTNGGKPYEPGSLRNIR